MNAVLARLFMTLATCCLGSGRRDWALAMEAELEVARGAGQPLAFAAGCLFAALRELPRHAEGRFALANHGLALFMLLPVAALQFMCAVGAIFPQRGALHGAPVPGSAHAVYLSDAYMAAVPTLLCLWLLLCMAHLRLAWALLEHDWDGVARIGSLIAAGTITLMVFTGVLFVDDSRTLLHAALLTVEAAALVATARWHAQLFACERFDPAY